MSTMNISIPDPMKGWVQTQIDTANMLGTAIMFATLFAK